MLGDRGSLFGEVQEIQEVRQGDLMTGAAEGVLGTDLYVFKACEGKEVGEDEHRLFIGRLQQTAPTGGFFEGVDRFLLGKGLEFVANVWSKTHHTLAIVIDPRSLQI